MNIAIIVPYFTPYVRGNEYGLAHSLAKLGHTVTIITSSARAPRENMLKNAALNKMPDLNFNVKYLPSVIDLGDNPIITGIKNYIAGQDLVMLQEDYPLICHQAFNTAKKFGIPTILSSERTYYPENKAKRLALKLLDATTNKKLRNGVDVLTAHCTAAKEYMNNELGAKRKITVINVGVDTQLFRPVQSEVKYLNKGEFKILTVARLHKYKGLNYLIAAMETIREEIPEVHLYIMGKGQEERNLRRLADKLQLNSIITFLTKPIPNYEMPELYSQCDIYVQPSIIEPYGIAVLEAMACGKPVVGTNVGGMRDTINEKTGFLADPGNSEEIAEYIKILYDENKRKR
ncbi:MAG: glycosyltransferase family 4 protein, partial [Candidatus Methanoperedens sp.]|nr:glycosyltransferase family 4 protein [Candidatus Methanoperedens sp.]